MSYHPGYPGQDAHHQSSYPGGPPPMPSMPSHSPAPPQQPQQLAARGQSSIMTTGSVEGASFKIDHRDSNSMLYLHLQPGCQIKAKPGSMVAMDATVKIEGKLKFSFKKAFTGGEVCSSSERGRGLVLVADGAVHDRCQSLPSRGLARSCSPLRLGVTSCLSTSTGRPPGPSAATRSWRARMASCGRRRARASAKRSVSPPAYSSAYQNAERETPRW